MNESLVQEYADKSLDNSVALSKLREQIAKTLQDEEDKRSRRRKRHPCRTAFRIFRQTFELKNRKTFVWWTTLSYSLSAFILIVVVFILQCVNRTFNVRNTESLNFFNTYVANDTNSDDKVTYPMDSDYWLLLEAFILLATGLGNAWLAISNNQLLKREVHLRCRYVLRQIDACLSDPAFESRWNAAHFLDLYCPTTPATTMCWTIRRRLVNMPLNLLVADDVILLRPGQRCAVHCRVLNVEGSITYKPGQTIVSPGTYVNESAAPGDSSVRKAPGMTLKCPLARKSVCAIPCIVTETPFVRNLVQVLHRNHQRPSSVIHRQVYWFVHVFVERHLLPCALGLTLLVSLAQMLAFTQLDPASFSYPTSAVCLASAAGNSSGPTLNLSDDSELRCGAAETRKRLYFAAWYIHSFVQTNLSMLSIFIPAAVFLCGILAVARVLVVFEELKTRVALSQTTNPNCDREPNDKTQFEMTAPLPNRAFGELRTEDESEADGYSKHIEAFHPEKVHLGALLRMSRAVLRFEAQTLPRSANIAYVLGSVTSLCCVDKRGIVSWPIPITERVCFLRRRHEHPVAAASNSAHTNAQSTHSNASATRGSRVDRTVSMSAATESPTSTHPTSTAGFSQHPFLKTNTHASLAVHATANTATGRLSPTAAAGSEANLADGKVVRPSSSFAGFDSVSGQTHAHSRSRPTVNNPSDTKLCVLDLTQDVTKRFALRFDDANWKRHLRSLKPLGLCTMLNSCNLATSEQFCRFTDQLSAVAALSEHEVAVVNRRCLCNLARQFGFADSCTTAYSVEQLIGLYSHHAVPERERDRIGTKRPRQPISASAITSPNEEHRPSAAVDKERAAPAASETETDKLIQDDSTAKASAAAEASRHAQPEEPEAELEVHETSFHGMGSTWKPSKANLVKQAPVPNVFSVIVRDSRTGESHLFAQGTADLLLSFCTDYWDGRNVVPLTAGDRHKILDFYNRNILSAYCIAMAYCPVLEPLLGKFPSDMFIELPTDMSETLSDLAKLLDSAKKWDAESLGGTDGDAHCQHTSTANSIDIDSFLRVQYGQIFLGMIATQYAVKRDVVDLVDNLERACIRFIYFSKENELRSRVFAERLGLEAGWNCHISLANPARSEKADRDSSDRESGHRATHDRERDRDREERQRYASGGSGERRMQQGEHEDPQTARSGTGSTEHCRPLTIAISGTEGHPSGSAAIDQTPTTSYPAMVVTSSPTPNWFRDAVPILPADTHEWKLVGDLNRSDSAPALFCGAAFDQSVRVQFAVDDAALPRKSAPYSAERPSARPAQPERTRPADLSGRQPDALLRSGVAPKRTAGVSSSPVKMVGSEVANTSRRRRSNESLNAKRDRDTSQIESSKRETSESSKIRRPSISIGRQHSSPSPPPARRGLMRRFRHGSYASSSTSSSSSSSSRSSSSSSSSCSRSNSSSSSSSSSSSCSSNRQDRDRSSSRSSVSSSSLEPHANSNVYDEDLVAFRRTTVKQKSRNRTGGRRKRNRKRRRRHKHKRERRRSGRFHRAARAQTSDPSATEPSAAGLFDSHRVTTPTRNQSRSQSQSLHDERSSQSQSHRGTVDQQSILSPNNDPSFSITRGAGADTVAADCELGTLSEDEHEHADGGESLSDAASSTFKLTHRSDDDEGDVTTLRSGDAADSDEFSLLAQNIAKLPRGIAQVRAHLERVDNVPLLVNLFTDCTEKAIVDMSMIMQDYNQVVCNFGSSLNADNIGAFLQADASIAIHPVYPPVCIRQPPFRPPDSCASSVCASVRESCAHTIATATATGANTNNAQSRERHHRQHAHTPRPLSPLHLAAVLNSLPCSLASTNSELRIGPMLMSLVCEARNFVCNMRYAYEFHFCVSMAMLIIQLLVTCVTLHRPFATQQLLWLTLVVRTSLSACLLAKPTDLDMVKRPLKRYQASAKVSKHTIREFCLHSGIRFVPSCIVVVICYVLNLLAMCQLCSSQLQPDTPTECVAFVWQFEQSAAVNARNVTLQFLPDAAVHGAQSFAQVQFFTYITLICAGVVYRNAYIWQWIAQFNRSTVFLVVSLILSLCQVGITALEVNSLSEDWSLVRLPVHSYIVAAVWVPLLLGVNELVKRRELRLDLRYQKQIRLEFGTKLGMNSPWA